MGYRPRVQRGAVIYDLPLPLLESGERFSRKTKTVDVPQQDGVFISETKRGALLVSFSGIITLNNQQDNARALGVVTSLQTERDRLVEQFIESNDPFIFYRYIAGATIAGNELNAAAGTRWYKNCVCEELAFDWTNRTLVQLPYSFTILVPDGVEWRYS